MDYSTASPIVRDFLNYHETIRGHSKKTVDEYFLDLRTFFRFLITKRNLQPGTPFEQVDISNIDIAFIKSITLNDIYDFMAYLSREREKHHNQSDGKTGLTAASRARKISAIRSFYKYLQQKAGVIDFNPMLNMDSPKLRQNLPRYLSENEAIALLAAPDGINKERDICILTIFLHCGLRISELVGLNISDINLSERSMRVLGKGAKERDLYINNSVFEAIEDYLKLRLKMPGVHTSSRNALFVTRQNDRISKAAVHAMVKKYLTKAGLDAEKYSAHKLRHTAATLMHHNGVDVRVLQEVLGHENLNTTQIYTHISGEGIKNAIEANPLNKRKK